MNVEFYTGVDERLDLPVVLPPTLDQVDITGADVLVADDVADTGKTLELVRDFCTGYVSEVRTAVIYEKPPSVVQCDYVWRRTDRWIDFRGRRCRRWCGAAAAPATDRGFPCLARSRGLEDGPGPGRQRRRWEAPHRRRVSGRSDSASVPESRDRALRWFIHRCRDLRWFPGATTAENR